MQLKISFNKINFILLSLCAIVFPINYQFFGSFRLLDIFIILLIITFVMSKPKINKQLFVIFALIISILSISNFIGLFQHQSLDFSRLIFLFKYLTIFILPWIVVKTINTNERILIINKLLLLNFIFLSSWTYIYLALVASGTIYGSFRPSFPFSNDFTASDAHLYSAYLGFFTITYMFYLKRLLNHGMLLAFLVITNGVFGLILTGSRTGLLLIGFAITAFFIYYMKNLFTKKHIYISINKLIYTIILILIIIILVLYYFNFIYEFVLSYEKLFERAFDFNLKEDSSSIGRIQKLGISLSDTEQLGFIFGVGLFSSLTWYDGILSILIAHGGILLIFSIVIFYSIIIRNSLRKTNNVYLSYVFFVLIFIYFIANLITEYIFVSRNSFPILVVLSILYLSIIHRKLNTDGN